LGSEDEERDEDEPTVGAGSTDPAELATAAAKAAWDAARYAKREDRIRAGRWAEVSRAFSSAVDAVMQTHDRYAVKEDGASEEYINPYQTRAIGVLSDDEIQTVMALRRGTAKVDWLVECGVPADAGALSDDEAESFEDWARRQIEKLARQLDDLARDAKYPEHAGERHVDPLRLTARMGGDGSPMPDIGRAVWAVMETSAMSSQVIPASIWEASKYGQVSITARSDGARIIRRS
jgi:hypothetical protein